MKFAMTALIAGLAVATSQPAFAERFTAGAKSFGRIDFDIRNGRLDAYYDKPVGRLSGNIISPGTATGLWLQPRSDRPCNSVRSGTNAWGTFVITNLGARSMAGFWGYCDEKPNRAFEFY